MHYKITGNLHVYTLVKTMLATVKKRIKMIRDKHENNKQTLRDKIWIISVSQAILGKYIYNAMLSDLAFTV